MDNAAQYTCADRGTWRWSLYYYRLDNATGRVPDPTCSETATTRCGLLKAEAHFRRGNLAAAADIINETRVFNGLNATERGGAEHELRAQAAQRHLRQPVRDAEVGEADGELPLTTTVRWFFDCRGWGDLYKGTPAAVPDARRPAAGAGAGPAYTFGGVGGTMAAPKSSYNFPGE